MGRLSALKGGDLFLLAFISIASLVFLFSESIQGCGTVSYSSFNCWRHGLYPVVVLFVVVSGLIMLAVLRNRFIRITHIILTIIVIIYLLLIGIFLTVDLFNANIDPNSGGRFSNIANDDRYCCLYVSAAMPGDCPPAHNPTLNLTEICSVAVSPGDLQLNSIFFWEYIWTLVYIVLFALVLALAFVIRSQVVSTKNDINEGYANKEDEEALLSAAEYPTYFKPANKAPVHVSRRRPYQSNKGKDRDMQVRSLLHH